MTKEQLVVKSEYKAMVLRLLSKLLYLRDWEIYEAADLLTELRFMEDKKEAAKSGERAFVSCGMNIAQKLCDDIIDCRRIGNEKN